MQASYLKTPLTAAQALAVGKPVHLRTIPERIDAMEGMAKAIVDLQQRMLDSLALFVDEIERRQVIEAFERAIASARKGAHT